MGLTLNTDQQHGRTVLTFQDGTAAGEIWYRDKTGAFYFSQPVGPPGDNWKIPAAPERAAYAAAEFDALAWAAEFQAAERSAGYARDNAKAGQAEQDRKAQRARLDKAERQDQAAQDWADRCTAEKVKSEGGA